MYTITEIYQICVINKKKNTLRKSTRVFQPALVETVCVGQEFIAQ